MIRLASAGIFCGLVFLSAFGCSGPVLSVNDAVVMGGVQAPLTAYLEQPVGLGFRNGLEEVPVQFSARNQPIGTGRTRDEGNASVVCTLPDPDCSQFEATVRLKGRTLRTSGKVFHWDPSRTIIVVDIDETLSVTDYGDLLFSRHDGGSRPIYGARETMTALARDYHIAYVTARPRFMLERTRRWLREHGFPDGPVMVSESWAEWRSQTNFKRNTLARLRQQWPNLLIGIGDKRADVEAYTYNRMLALIVNEKDADRYGRKAMTMPDWPTLARFFAEHHDVLSRPAMLAARISPEGKLLPPPRDAVARRTVPGSQEPQARRSAAAVPPQTQRDRRG
jgi:hypothetical protein